MEGCVLVTDHHRVHWVDPGTARVVASLAEGDRTRRRTHHVSRLVADSKQTRHVVHCASDPGIIHAMVRQLLLDAGVHLAPVA